MILGPGGGLGSRFLVDFGPNRRSWQQVFRGFWAQQTCCENTLHVCTSARRPDMYFLHVCDGSDAIPRACLRACAGASVGASVGVSAGTSTGASVGASAGASAGASVGASAGAQEGFAGICTRAAPSCCLCVAARVLSYV